MTAGKRPGGLTALAVLNFVFGGFGALGVLAMGALIALVNVGANAASVSPVQKVIQLLGELKVKVENDIAAETKAMDEYTEFCDDEITEKKHSIEVAASDIEAYNAVIEESNGKITELSSVLADAGSVSFLSYSYLLFRFCGGVT